MFNNFNLEDDEIIEIIKQYEPFINKECIINGVLNEDLKQEICIKIYKSLTKNRKK